MLKKLLKYDLKYVFKMLLVFYVLALFFGILTKLFLNVKNSFILEMIGQICSGVTITMFFNIVINNVIRLWLRFKNNFYGDESYLTHTLPVKKETLYLSKILTTIISLFISMFVIFITLGIAYYSKENIEWIKSFLLLLATTYHSTIIKILLGVFFILFLELLNIIQSGYMGIILGYKKNQMKLGYSILFGFCIYTVTQIFALVILFLIAIFNKDIMNLFFTNSVINVEYLKIIFVIASIIYSIIFMTSYIINNILFKKGVNIE